VCLLLLARRRRTVAATPPRRAKCRPHTGEQGNRRVANRPLSCPQCATPKGEPRRGAGARSAESGWMIVFFRPCVSVFHPWLLAGVSMGADGTACACYVARPKSVWRYWALGVRRTGRCEVANALRPTPSSRGTWGLTPGHPPTHFAGTPGSARLWRASKPSALTKFERFFSRIIPPMVIPRTARNETFGYMPPSPNRFGPLPRRFGRLETCPTIRSAARTRAEAHATTRLTINDLAGAGQWPRPTGGGTRASRKRETEDRARAGQA
jgi:hypothetical protein